MINMAVQWRTIYSPAFYGPLPRKGAYKMIQEKLENNGACLFYQVSGNGFPLIFTHGASWNHKQWQKQVEFFKDRYTVVTWDVRGHGYSTLPDGPVDSEDFTADLISLMDHLGIEKAILCGLSMGGHISLQTAVRYPNRVTGLILIGTPCSNTFNLFEKVFVPVNRLSSRFIPMKTYGKMQAQMLSKFNKSNAEYIKEAVSMIPHNNWNRIWAAVTRMESRADLPKIQCPTLLLIGDHDNLTKRQQSYMLENISNCQMVTIPNAQHGTNLDNPEAVNQAIMEFVQNIQERPTSFA